ncbi:hypothetical protein PG997_001870 [Apiospora hydei]|uniref:Uncharacterized protein n=1 Tax=Apiospora hydei TaxID=1337664 RepID=A0ABR1X7Q5_9PEZI
MPHDPVHPSRMRPRHAAAQMIVNHKHIRGAAQQLRQAVRVPSPPDGRAGLEVEEDVAAPVDGEVAGGVERG